jgi:hypothetical protein
MWYTKSDIHGDSLSLISYKMAFYCRFQLKPALEANQVAQC